MRAMFAGVESIETKLDVDGVYRGCVDVEFSGAKEAEEAWRRMAFEGIDDCYVTAVLWGHEDGGKGEDAAERRDPPRRLEQLEVRRDPVAPHHPHPEHDPGSHQQPEHPSHRPSVSVSVTSLGLPPASLVTQWNTAKEALHTSSSKKRRASEPGEDEYRDRAAERRQVFGSGPAPTTGKNGGKPNPSIGPQAQPPQPLAMDNAGAKMLQKMGWQGYGHGLGKDGSGIQTPIKAKQLPPKRGIGGKK